LLGDKSHAKRPPDVKPIARTSGSTIAGGGVGKGRAGSGLKSVPEDDDNLQSGRDDEDSVSTPLIAE